MSEPTSFFFFSPSDDGRTAASDTDADVDTHAMDVDDRVPDAHAEAAAADNDNREHAPELSATKTKHQNKQKNAGFVCSGPPPVQNSLLLSSSKCVCAEIMESRRSLEKELFRILDCSINGQPRDHPSDHRVPLKLNSTIMQRPLVPHEILLHIVSFCPLPCHLCQSVHLRPCASAECLSLCPIEHQTVNNIFNRCATCDAVCCAKCVHDNALSICDLCDRDFCALKDCGRVITCECHCIDACKDCVAEDARLMECGNPGCKTFYCRCPNCRERLAFQCLRCGYVCCRDSDLNCIDGMRECASCLGFYCCGCIMTHVVACGF